MELWTGKQLFSVLLRPHAKMKVYLNLTVAEKSYGKSRESMCPKDGFVHIRNSELISGQLGKATLGQCCVFCNLFECFLSPTWWLCFFFIHFKEIKEIYQKLHLFKYLGY